jgi:predicted unusual protein kinase regulating ubiquinone biosynthesis (AarF/ABC1/UbiB family)
MRIYGSYKTYQIKKLKSKLKPSSNKNSTMTMTWDDVHEINSKRMINLCLSLRGFYLKTGQFLGTRHDFMPIQYIEKLSRLHDNVPPLNAKKIRNILKKELRGKIEDYFSSIDLDKPIGSASIAQVHEGIWKKTGEKVAVKIQYPGAAGKMKNDLRNLRVLAEFLQRTELKFDILSAIIELQKNIMNEFNFEREAKNMKIIGDFLAKKCPEVTLPKPVYFNKKVLVMTYVEGTNLGRIAEFKDTKTIPALVKQNFGKRLFKTLSKVWAEQIFVLQMVNCDPHPYDLIILLF